MSAVVPILGKTRPLDRAAEPDEQITPEQAKDASILARLLMRLLREVALLKRRFWPRHIDFEDIVVDSTGATLYRYEHNFSGRVRYWPVDVTSLTPVSVGFGTATIPPTLVQHSSTDNNTLVLVSYVGATLTLRVQEAG